jgi:hypothetical protein
MLSTEGRDTEIVHAYRAGASLREVGFRYGVTPDQVRYVLVRLGVPRRPKLKPTRADPATVWKRLIEGESLRAVAEDYGYAGPASLGAMLRRHGYKPMSLRAVEHGSLSMYTYGCRCDDCRAAKSAYARAWSRKAREELTVAGAPPATIPARRHGQRATYNRGCRCDDCRAAGRAYARAWYRKARDQQQRQSIGNPKERIASSATLA